MASNGLRVSFVVLLISGWLHAAQADDVVVADFESETFGDWKEEGDAFGSGSVLASKLQVQGFRGNRFVNSFGPGDKATGSLTSPPFEITRRYITFLISGGKHPGETGIELLVGDKSLRSATGADSAVMRWESWDVAEFRGQRARLRIFDRAVGGWGHINVDHILLTDAPRLGAGTQSLAAYRKSSDYYREPWRPGYHFTPEMNWMNDPNGLVFFDGEYHLFYQHNPHGNEWGHMSWGHAVSHDLVHWKHLPIALHEEYGVMAFSGSCVVDSNNTSGFGTGKIPPLVALFTGHGHGRQTQDIAYSNDRGRTWTKFAENPVIDINEADFRDPKVFWHAPTKRWIMAVSLAVKKQVQFYGSPDLKHWTFLSEFGPAGSTAKLNWECPDLYELPIENETGKSRWVLSIGMGNGSVAGGSGDEYFTGEFDGVRFKADSAEAKWVDFGRDFYAPVTWSNIPREDGRTIWIGWMNNWETCLNPTSPWRSSMSSPRELTLRNVEGALRLCQRPVRELKSLRKETRAVTARDLENESIDVGHRGRQLEIVVEFEPGTAREFGLHVLKKGAQQTSVGYNVEKKELFVDRRQSGEIAFHPAFSGRHAGPLASSANGRVRLHLLVDACSVEAFGNDGETVVTDLVFPDRDSDGVELYAIGGRCRVVACEIYSLNAAQ